MIVLSKTQAQHLYIFPPTLDNRFRNFSFTSDHYLVFEFAFLGQFLQSNRNVKTYHHYLLTNLPI